MNKLLIICTFLCLTINVTAQNVPIDTIRCRISQRDSVLSEKISNQTRADMLMEQVNDLKALSQTLTDSCEVLMKDNAAFRSELETYRILSSPDTTIFYTPLSNMAVPKCLETHIALITRISELNKALKEVYIRIDTLNQTLTGDKIDKIIASQIEDDIYALNNEFSLIFEMDLSTLSPEQQAFLKPGLTEKFNNLLTYFE